MSHAEAVRLVLATFYGVEVENQTILNKRIAAGSADEIAGGPAGKPPPEAPALAAIKGKG